MSRLCVWLLAVPVAGAVGACASAAILPAAVVAQGALPVVVARAPAAPAWLATLRAAGGSAEVGTAAQAAARGAGVVPAGAALTGRDVAALVAATRAGGRFVVADPRLASALGFGRRPARTIRTLRMAGLEPTVRLAAAPVEARAPTAAPGHTLERLAWSGGLTIVARSRVGAGTVVVTAFDPFAAGLDAASTLPLLGRLTVAATGAPPGPERDGVDVYLDPGHTRGTPDEIAARVAAASVVHVAGWNGGYADASLDYPYGPLLDALHRRGISVYAWLEPPFVTHALWAAHPECRERRLDGADAVDGWRPLFALEDARCLDLAWAQWSTLLARYPFDGVDLAELYWASTDMPGHPAALSAFPGSPRSRPAAWLAFRRDLLLDLTARIVARLKAHPSAPAVVVTAIDDHLDPALARRIGSDVGRLAPVLARAGATLEVEDPYTVWTRGPGRYVTLSRHVEQLMSPRRAFIDVNVVPREYAYPTPTMTGAELELSVANAGRAPGRIALYSVATMLAGDLERMPAALAAAATTEGSVVRAPWTVVVRTPRAGNRRLLVDGGSWPSHGGSAIVPPGRHVIRWLPGTDGRPALLRLSGELVTAAATATSLSFTYTAAERARAVVDRAPASVAVDGVLVTTPAGVGATALTLPAGRHVVTVGFQPGLAATGSARR